VLQIFNGDLFKLVHTHASVLSLKQTFLHPYSLNAHELKSISARCARVRVAYHPPPPPQLAPKLLLPYSHPHPDRPPFSQLRVVQEQEQQQRINTRPCGKYDPLWFSYIFDYLRPSESDRIELRSLCTFFRDILPRPKQMWTYFPCKKHATLDSLLESVQAVWEKNPLR